MSTAPEAAPGPDPAALVAAAAAARERAYAPYSRFAVGAALAVRGLPGPVCGVNVENCSYGLTTCAERHAVGAAVLAGMVPGALLAVAVVGPGPGPTAPCGACRQVLAEFAAPGATLLMAAAGASERHRVPLAALLPHAFGAADLSPSRAGT